MAVLGKIPVGLNCRSIAEADWEEVISCLCRGFPQRDRVYWTQALSRQSQMPAVADFPRYGFILEIEGKVVGVVLTIYVLHQGPEGEHVRCNLSSWYVDVDYRPYASKMIAVLLRQRTVTFINVSPAPDTRKVNEALGFRLFSKGQFAFLPVLSSMRSSYRVLEVKPDLPELAMLPESERHMLAEHAALGCWSLLCVDQQAAYPFVLMPRKSWGGLVPTCQVIYCRDMAALSRCAGTLGRFLLRKGIFISLVDATAAVPNLVGRYFDDRGVKYVKGPNPPPLGDLTFTELVLFGP
ncbi:MAG: hypothetical protein BGP04_13530 [Rhizobiales bacterium 62-17]|nr:MAG: hypothetical protein BGP04_13530 [Rhizobiales bacterium 62-17]